MARRKKVSRVLEKAQQREASLRSISSQLDLGNGLTLDTYSSRLQDLQSLVSNYNTTLSLLDKLSDDIATMEQEVRDLSEKMLMGVGVKYGKSSQEYGMAGGVPKNKRRRSTSQQSSSSVTPTQFHQTMPASTYSTTSEPTNGKALVA
ncbi:hypothetical protein K9N68_31270 [Kovacikia minuta CCNUW1]|uniref:hypothetical protein n=1 Tax=Kovacikia minuta TaxID=2931930 RepID=UPI001CCACEED|nr:hypothetical protein [Kovacikia minuta]UBF25969.1 hypothetical protein K9N68_31270 [Kovacikia minuta CCNUW1]